MLDQERAPRMPKDAVHMVDANCIFCKIIQGTIPCQQVLRTETVLAFLDLNPVHPGHTLVVPTSHHVTLMDLPAAMGNGLLDALSRVARGVMAATGADGVNLMQNNHPAAGQVVMHAHFHLIPRFADDGLALWPQRPYSSADAMADMAQRIAAAITAA
ncbi:HIT family protein [Megalodesulfovibrio paquesii]